jgi:hypothetical protein
MSGSNARMIVLALIVREVMFGVLSMSSAGRMAK